MLAIAQTNIQLFNHLQRNGWGADDLALVRRGYELAMRLYAGHFQADGKPFVSHGVGVASVMAHLGMPAQVVAAACVHNVYGNGDFGDGLEHCVTPFRRGRWCAMPWAMTSRPWSAGCASCGKCMPPCARFP